MTMINYNTDKLKLQIKKVIYLVTLSNQLPSIISIKNNYLLILTLTGFISSIILRIISIDLDILNSIWLFSTYVLISLSLIYLLYLQINIVLRLFHSIHLIPIFYKLIKENKKENLAVIGFYYLKTFILIGLSLYIVYRMVFSLNAYMESIYTYTLLTGLILSIYITHYYKQTFKLFNCNVKLIPFWVLALICILGIFWILLVPVFIGKLLDNLNFIAKFNSNNLDISYMLPNDRAGPNPTNYTNKIANDNTIRSGTSTPVSTENLNIRMVSNNNNNRKYSWIFYRKKTTFYSWWIWS